MPFTADGPAKRTIEQEFQELTAEWKEQAAALSSPSEIGRLPAYQRIIGLGNEALPLIVREMEREPDFWFEALRAITGVNPVPRQARGDLKAMTEAWLRWARKTGVI